MDQKLLTENCDCCGVETPIFNLSIVCPECLHHLRNEKQKEQLFKMDWEEDNPNPDKKIICHPKDWDMTTEEEDETAT
jgi:hypothetical protein